MKKLIALLLAISSLLTLCACGAAAPAAAAEPDGYKGIDVASPDWVGKQQKVTRFRSLSVTFPDDILIIYQAS